MLYFGIGFVCRLRIFCERVGFWEWEVFGWDEGFGKVYCLGLKRVFRNNVR